MSRAFYIVICDHADGPYVPETEVAWMDRATVMRHLKEKQYDQPAKVIEFVPTEGTCRDASHEFLNANPNDQ